MFFRRVDSAWRRGGAQNISPAVFTRASRSTISLVIVLTLTATLAAASSPVASIKLGGSPAPAEIVRCHFDEGRIVIRYADTLHVLHEGDELAATGLHLAEITPETAIMVIRQPSPTASLRIIKISKTDSGTLVLREIATDPAALSSGSEAESVPMSSIARSAQPAAPPGAS